MGLAVCRNRIIDQQDHTDYFEPKQTVAWLIGNSDYSNVRKQKPGVEDVTQAIKDLELMEALCCEDLHFDRVFKSINADGDNLQ